MERNDVASAGVRSVGYDAQALTLEIEYADGGVYQYYGVPEHMYEQMMSAPSKGKFVNTYIKNQYPFSRTG